MKNALQMVRFFPLDRFELFDYLSTASMLEKWAFPDGMTLKIPIFESREGGQYRYEHTSQDGVYVATGYVKEFVPGERLVQLDEKITDPSGKLAYSNIESTLRLRPRIGGTEVTLTSTGFNSAKDVSECEQGWRQSFNHLESLIKLRAQEERRDRYTGTDSNISG